MTYTQPHSSPDPKAGFWLSSPNVAAAEIGAHLGYGFAILDIEHGAFGLADLERFIPVLKGLKLEVLAKVLGPQRAPIQQALDFGADAVVIPHIEGRGHAAEVTSYAKFAPVGSRGFAGGRTTSYGGFTDEWVEAQNARTRCLPMIERADALADIEAILDLPTVDGVFMGSSDLSLSRGRGSYKRGAADFEDIETVAKAAQSAGKTWGMGAWSPEEKELCVRLDAHQIACTMEHAALVQGFGSGLEALRSVSE